MITHKSEFVLSLKINIMVNNAAIELAIAALESSEIINFTATAKEFEIDRNKLRRRYYGQCVPKEEAMARCAMKLSPEQEEVLVRHIIELTNRGTPPSTRIVKNFAEEMIRDYIGEQWIKRFIKRHQSRLKSIYLRSMDHQRQKAEFRPHFIEFYRLVSSNPLHITP